MMETKFEVPAPVRDLVAIGIDNVETAFAFFFDAATKSVAPASAESIVLLKRVIAVKIDYARKVAVARDLSEAMALQFAYCRAQIEMTTDLIRIVSESTEPQN